MSGVESAERSGAFRPLRGHMMTDQKSTPRDCNDFFDADAQIQDYGSGKPTDRVKQD